MSSVYRTSTLLALAFSAACSSGDDEVATNSARIDTLPSGQITVANERGGTWADSSTWTLVEDLRLGAMDSEGPEQFSQIAAILPHPDGRIYLLDYPTQEIRVFGPDGTFLHQFGRPGEGPGELQQAAGLNWGPDGNLWVWGGIRYSIFSPDGEFVDSHQRPISGLISPWPGGFAPDGRYIDWGLRQDYSAQRQVDQFTVRVFTGRVFYHPIAFTPPDQVDTLATLEFQGQVTAEGQPMEPSHRLIMSQSRDGHLWIAETDEYVVRRLTLDGDTLLTFSLPSQPMPVTEAEIDSTLAQFEGLRGPLPTPTRESFVSHHRLVTRVLPDNAGHVYVFPQEDGLPEGNAVDVFGDNGIYLGRMDIPERILVHGPAPYVTGEHIYAVRQDEQGVPYLLRLRIVRE